MQILVKSPLGFYVESQEKSYFFFLKLCWDPWNAVSTSFPRLLFQYFDTYSLIFVFFIMESVIVSNASFC